MDTEHANSGIEIQEGRVNETLRDFHSTKTQNPFVDLSKVDELAIKVETIKTSQNCLCLGLVAIADENSKSNIEIKESQNLLMEQVFHSAEKLNQLEKKEDQHLKAIVGLQETIDELIQVNEKQRKANFVMVGTIIALAAVVLIRK